MKIFIKHSNLEKIDEYEIDDTDTIEDLKTQILRTHNYTTLKLIFSGKVLKKDKTFEELDINDENMLIAFGEMKTNNTPNIEPLNTNQNFVNFTERPPPISINPPPQQPNNTQQNNNNPRLDIPYVLSGLSSLTQTLNSIPGIYATLTSSNNDLNSMNNFSRSSSDNNNLSSFFNNIINTSQNVQNVLNNDPLIGSITSSFNQMFNIFNSTYDLNQSIVDINISNYTNELEQLQGLGFYNTTHNINALRYSEGNIENAVSILINNA
jgi:hypothetical protein